MPDAGSSLSAAFTARLGGASQVADRAALEAALQAIVARAHAAWPAIELDAATFAAELASRVSGDEPLAAVEKLHAEDLFIACAVSAGAAGALAAFEQRFLPAVGREVASIDRSPAFIDEVQQLLREWLFVPRDGRSGLAQYAGRGQLGKWLRISALRIGVRLRSGSRRETDLDQLDRLADDALLAGPRDPEVEYLKATYRQEFRRAFHDALAVLSPRDRTVLKLNTLDGLNGEEIAAFFNVSRASSSRWLAHAKETLHARTRELLTERLGLAPSQIESLAGLVLSQLELSLNRVLKE